MACHHIIPYSNSESSLHAGKSVQLQMQDLQQVYEVIFHPMMYTYIIKYQNFQVINININLLQIGWSFLGFIIFKIKYHFTLTIFVYIFLKI